MDLGYDVVSLNLRHLDKNLNSGWEGSSGSCQHIKYHRASRHCILSDANVETFYAVIQPQL
jgi:hypothetical protein